MFAFAFCGYERNSPKLGIGNVENRAAKQFQWENNSISFPSFPFVAFHISVGCEIIFLIFGHISLPTVCYYFGGPLSKPIINEAKFY